jgi:cold shock CspA family protein
MFGIVTNYFPDRGYGFILGNDNNTYYVHWSNLNGEYLERGYYVYFKTFQNDRSDYNARRVIPIEANKYSLRYLKRSMYPKRKNYKGAYSNGNSK